MAYDSTHQNYLDREAANERERADQIQKSHEEAAKQRKKRDAEEKLRQLEMELGKLERDLHIKELELEDFALKQSRAQREVREAEENHSERGTEQKEKELRDLKIKLDKLQREEGEIEHEIEVDTRTLLDEKGHTKRNQVEIQVRKRKLLEDDRMIAVRRREIEPLKANIERIRDQMATIKREMV